MAVKKCARVISKFTWPFPRALCFELGQQRGLCMTQRKICCARVMVAAQQIDGTPGVVERVYRDMIRRYDVCNDVVGRHIEPLFLMDLYRALHILYRRQKPISATVQHSLTLLLPAYCWLAVKRGVAKELSFSHNSRKEERVFVVYLASEWIREILVALAITLKCIRIVRCPIKILEYHEYLCRYDMLNLTVLSALEPASFLHWLLHGSELHVIGAQNCEVLIYWRRVTQGQLELETSVAGCKFSMLQGSRGEVRRTENSLAVNFAGLPSEGDGIPGRVRGRREKSALVPPWGERLGGNRISVDESTALPRARGKRRIRSLVNIRHGIARSTNRIRGDGWGGGEGEIDTYEYIIRSYRWKFVGGLRAEKLDRLRVLQAPSRTVGFTRWFHTLLSIRATNTSLVVVVHTSLHSRTLGQTASIKDCQPLGCGSLYSLLGRHLESSPTLVMRRGGLRHQPVSPELSYVVAKRIGNSSRGGEVCDANKSRCCQHSRDSQKGGIRRPRAHRSSLFRRFEMNFISISSPALNSNGAAVFLCRSRIEFLITMVQPGHKPNTPTRNVVYFTTWVEQAVARAPLVHGCVQITSRLHYANTPAGNCAQTPRRRQTQVADPRENPVTSSDVRHDSHVRKSGEQGRTQFAQVGAKGCVDATVDASVVSLGSGRVKRCTGIRSENLETKPIRPHPLQCTFYGSLALRDPLGQYSETARVSVKIHAADGRNNVHTSRSYAGLSKALVLPRTAYRQGNARSVLLQLLHAPNEPTDADLPVNERAVLNFILGCLQLFLSPAKPASRMLHCLIPAVADSLSAGHWSPSIARNSAIDSFVHNNSTSGPEACGDIYMARRDIWKIRRTPSRAERTRSVIQRILQISAENNTTVDHGSRLYFETRHCLPPPPPSLSVARPRTNSGGSAASAKGECEQCRTHAYISCEQWRLMATTTGRGGGDSPKELFPPSPMDWRSWHRRGGVLSPAIHTSCDLISFHSTSNQQNMPEGTQNCEGAHAGVVGFGGSQAPPEALPDRRQKEDHHTLWSWDIASLRRCRESLHSTVVMPLALTLVNAVLLEKMAVARTGTSSRQLVICPSDRLTVWKRMFPTCEWVSAAGLVREPD
ncbi:hypothetical protein PR048_032795 [Dryococelus australis]|uniref:Uncharacterized protein n=1 Tax=Dryococelus australis TaxID=614101 RepID=A0ABQ9G380_9NEOP|nr:hypothetical protein PR048_032795 [Dryococelus australis]